MSKIKSVFNRFISSNETTLFERKQAYLTKVMLLIYLTGCFVGFIFISGFFFINLSGLDSLVFSGVILLGLSIAVVISYLGAWKKVRIIIPGVSILAGVLNLLYYDFEIPYISLVLFTLAILLSFLLLEGRTRWIIVTLSILTFELLGPFTRYVFFDLDKGLFTFYIYSTLAYFIVFIALLNFYTNQFTSSLQKLDSRMKQLKKEVMFRKKAQKEILKLLKSREEIFINMSHEIRTPLSSIVGLSELIQRTVLTKEQERYIRDLNNSVKNVLVIVNDILDYAKLTDRSVVIEPFNIAEIATYVVDSLKFQIKEKKFRFKLEIDNKLPKTVMGDPYLLQLIMGNLLSNSVKFTNTGQVTLKVLLGKLGDEQAEIRIIVQDSGIGIKKDVQKQVFEAFKQGDGSVSRRVGGSGLGLAIVKRSVEVINGKINLESEEGKGTKFEVIINFGISNSENRIHKKDKIAADESIKKINNKIVLLIEDNKINQLVTKKLLESVGVKVIIRDSSKNILRVLKEQQIDIIIMDLQMPGIDGFSATRLIREKFSQKLPIIIVSAHLPSREKDKAFEAGANDYLTKPFIPEELYKKIASNLLPR